MATLFDYIKKIATKNKSGNEGQAAVIFGLIALGLLTVNYINQKNAYVGYKQQEVTPFGCETTKYEDAISLDTSDLKTNTALSIINYDTEIHNSTKKNTIPAIRSPKLIKINNLKSCLGDDDEFIVVKINNELRAYPLRILRFHEAINDKIGDINILVSYSTLSNHIQVFNRNIKNEVYEFYISGKLYRNGTLFFDTRTETLWSQLNGKALIGNMIGAKLETIPFEVLSLKDINEKHGDINSISFQTGFIKDYNDNPFLTYGATDDEIVQTPIYSNSKLKNKEQVLGFLVDNKAYALNISKFKGFTGKKTFENNIVIEFSNGEILSVYSNNKNIPFDLMYWFVWYDLYPNTTVL